MHVRNPALLLAALLIATGCGGDFDPDDPGQIFDALEQAGVLTCTHRVSMGERTEACTSPDGDLFAVVTADPTRVIQETRVEFGGPWVVDPDWVIVSADDDLERVRALRDAIGEGALYLDVDEVPVQVD